MPTNASQSVLPSGPPKRAEDPHSGRDVALETRHLSRAVPGKVLVNEISVQVPREEVLAVVGPSGAGKSSFLRLLNRLDEPTSGTVLLDGQDYYQLAPRDLRRRVGMVMQAAYLFPGTVAENLRFGPRQQGKDLAPSEIDALLQEVGLEGFANQDVAYLSGGEAQRVSLARTLANGPAALVTIRVFCSIASISFLLHLHYAFP